MRGKKLILFGGGKKPKDALARFVEWAGGAREAKVLIVAWASPDPWASRDALTEEFRQLGVPPVSVESSLRAPTSEEGKADFLEQLARASGVFLCGGDQNLYLDAFADSRLKAALKKRYEEGLAVAGTSAGTAIQSPLCIAGDVDPTRLATDAVLTRQGLGLLPGTIVDQHFLKRQRQNRLFALALKNPHLIGIGVDEDAALSVRDNHHLEVFGKPRQVMIVDPGHEAGVLGVRMLSPGVDFDLRALSKHREPAQVEVPALA